MRTLRIGSRGSALALWQANAVRGGLGDVRSEIVVVKTSGDLFTQAHVAEMGRKGVFIKELEDALLERRIDLAVHSMKDVPTELPAGLRFPAICRRDDPRDCLLSREGHALSQLPRGARLGTSSLRRQAQLGHARGDLKFSDLRGNVDTRIRKLEAGEFDAIVLAKAGLDRLGWSQKITEVLSAEVCLPAAGQGALGVEARAEDGEVAQALAGLEHAETRDCVTAERALLAALEGGCMVPLGAWARVEGNALILDACLCAVDGSEILRERVTGSAARAAELGEEAAQKLLKAGGGRILREAGRAVQRA